MRELVTGSQLATILGVSEDRIFRLKSRGVLRGEQYGKRVRFDVAEARQAIELDAREPRRSQDELTCCVCRRLLGREQFQTLTERQRQGGRVYEYVKPSSDCRDCSNEKKRQARARAQGFQTWEEWQAAKGTERERSIFLRATERAAKTAEREAADAEQRALRTPQALEERHKRGIANAVRRQRERRHSDPEYQAARNAMKVRRKRAQAGTQVVPVNRELVAQRDGWCCGICGKRVTRATWSLDHIVPLSRGGSHTYANIVLAHRSCNSRRGVGRLPVQPALFPLLGVG